MRASTNTVAGWALIGRGLLRSAPLFAALLVGLPVLVVLMSLFDWDSGAQAHVWATTGPLYLLNTALLCGMVGAGAALIGVSAAALVSMSEFPLRRPLALLLAAPFAVPAYISAYAWADALGPFGAFARVGFLDIRSLPGAAFILTLALYPYVYLAARASFEARSGAFMEAARASGRSPIGAFVSVLLPAGRAAFAAGTALALMETAADYGVAEHFGVPTLGVGIFRTWHGFGDLGAASQLAAGLFLFALIFVTIEEAARRGLAAEGVRASRATSRIALAPLPAAGAVLFCAVPVLLGFGVPVQILAMQLPSAQADFSQLAGAAFNTASLSLAAAIVAIVIAATTIYALRASTSPLLKFAARAATLGYALPGSVLAVGILGAAGAAGGAVAGLALLVYAYVARFLTAAYGALGAGIAQIHPQTDEAARSLGASALSLGLKVHLPMAAPAIRAALLVVFIDAARELPATLLLRPFNFETLATAVFRLASDERLAEASPAALALIAISLAPVIVADRLIRRR